MKQLPYDFKIDVWGIGCCLYHICALEPPFKADNVVTLGNLIVKHEPFPLPSSYYSEELNEFVQKLLEKEPIRRPNASQMLSMIPKHVV